MKTVSVVWSGDLQLEHPLFSIDVSSLHPQISEMRCTCNCGRDDQESVSGHFMAVIKFHLFTLYAEQVQ